MLTKFNQKRRWRRLNKLYGFTPYYNREMTELWEKYGTPDWKYYSDAFPNVRDNCKVYGVSLSEGYPKLLKYKGKTYGNQSKDY